jgi:hypothetical protein
MVDAVKLYEYFPASLLFAEMQVRSVPSDSAGQVPLLVSSSAFLVEVTFNAPVMRQIQFTPARIIEVWLVRARSIALRKPPIKIKAAPRSSRRLAHADGGANDNHW